MIKNNIILTQSQIEELNRICYKEIILKAQTESGIKVFQEGTLIYIEAMGEDLDIIQITKEISILAETNPVVADIISGTKYSIPELESLNKIKIK